MDTYFVEPLYPHASPAFPLFRLVADELRVAAKPCRSIETHIHTRPKPDTCKSSRYDEIPGCFILPHGRPWPGGKRAVLSIRAACVSTCGLCMYAFFGGIFICRCGYLYVHIHVSILCAYACM